MSIDSSIEDYLFLPRLIPNPTSPRHARRTVAGSGTGAAGSGSSTKGGYAEGHAQNYHPYKSDELILLLFVSIIQIKDGERRFLENETQVITQCIALYCYSAVASLPR